MAQATVKTVQFLDPRIEPQPDPVYDYVIGPTQNQYYKIPASGLSNSSINFNNLTTLGIDRAYLDTFEIELEADITFQLATSAVVKQYTVEEGTGVPSATPATYNTVTLNYTDEQFNALPDHMKNQLRIISPTPETFTFDSFPFNKACDEVRVNINGGAFFSQPMSYARAKERYMDQTKLCRSYQNVCPCIRPMLQTESGRTYRQGSGDGAGAGIFDDMISSADAAEIGNTLPSRYPSYAAHNGYNPTPEGGYGSLNNSILKTDTRTLVGTGSSRLYCNFTCASVKHNPKNGTTTYHVKWREPIFCSPFSSRYDATFGRPLYNITSMDIQFTMPTLGNMIRVFNRFPLFLNEDFPATVPAANLYHPDANYYYYHYQQVVDSYDITINSAKLCYQVMTIPPILNKPLTTLVPYRRFVPYITDYVQTLGSTSLPSVIPANGGEIEITSGVYTLNEIPTAIWIFCAPTKATYQSNHPDNIFETFASALADPGNTNPPHGYDHSLNVLSYGNYDSNKMFAYLKHLDISMANTTQLLNQAEPEDLYRIAVANGCQDSFWSWNSDNIGVYSSDYSTITDGAKALGAIPGAPWGVGSVIRLRPGVDLIIPDQPLIPGANGNNMVFQAKCKFVIPPHSRTQTAYSLWLLFEYVGVAAISPGQCEITMNPLGSGEIMAVSPVMSSTSEATEGEVEGSGHWDKANRAARIAGQLADDGIISMILKRIPGAGKAAEWAKKHGLGEPSARRGRADTSGGAVIGKGLNAWV